MKLLRVIREVLRQKPDETRSITPHPAAHVKPRPNAGRRLAADLDAVMLASDEHVCVQAAYIETRSLHIVDLCGIESTRMRVKGVDYQLLSRERGKYLGTEYLLVREPDNPADRFAIAVYGNRRRVGYVSAKRAALLAPLLDSVEADAFAVAGATTQAHADAALRAWVDLPRVPALRAHLRR